LILVPYPRSSRRSSVSKSPASSFEPIPGLGHNLPLEPIDTIEALDLRLARTHRELVVRFIDLELGCGRIPDPITSESEAATTTDFIAQCQAHIKSAETTHRKEKEFFLKGGRIVDAFFKRHRVKLLTALAPATARLKAYRDQVAEREAKRHDDGRQAMEAEAQRAAEEEAQYRAEANRLVREAGSSADRQGAAQQLLLAEEAGARAAAARQAAALKPVATRIYGDYGSTAYTRRTWTFEVADLDQVPREYMSLDVDVVREAINKDAVREIPGLRIFQMETLHVRGAA
jgi:hypothetical protein